MRFKDGGTHPQRSVSTPPDLLSSIPQQPQSPPPQKPPFSPTKAMMSTTTPLSFSPPSDHQQAPHVMVSRINARLSSFDNGADSKDTIFSTSPFAQDETTTDDSWSVSTNESSGHGVLVQTSASSSVSSSLSYNGRWCEEERAIPLKKRRVLMVSYETKQSKEIVKQDIALERKREMGKMEGYERCNRRNGKGWRCSKMRVKGHNLCKHHLEMQRIRNVNPSGRNQMKERKRVRVVKARSMSSLLRDTVPLLC